MDGFLRFERGCSSCSMTVFSSQTTVSPTLAPPSPRCVVKTDRERRGESAAESVSA